MSIEIKNYQKEWKEISVKVNELVLDPANIRLENEKMGQDEIIADLFVNEKTMSILESILENGFFPDETPVVVHEKGKYVVLEGNRRVASLQAMLTPEIVPEIFANKIIEIMKGAIPLKNIFVRVASNRGNAQIYLAAKHTKTTRRPWSALRRAYFYYAQKERGLSIEDLIKKYKGVDVPQYIKMYEMHRIALALKKISEEVRENLASRRTFNISTLERLYNDQYVQNKLGISFSDNGEVLVPKNKDFEKAYSRIIADIVDKIITSRKRISDPQGRKDYIDEVIPIEIENKKTTNAAAFNPIEPARKSKNILDTKGINFQLPYPAVERVFNEIEGINIGAYPNATHDLLRSFLECALKAFFELHEIEVKKKSPYTYLEDALREFETNSIVQDLAKNKYIALKKLVSSIRQNEKITSFTSEYMNQINHNHYFFSDRDSVKTAWDNLKPLFMFILSEIPLKIRDDNH